MMITRFAPSPTGHLHIGGARTALFNYLLARGQGGRFILRIEDTDVQRSEEAYAAGILEAMTWLGLSWDGEPVRQSARTGLHREFVQRLLSEGAAYWCSCRPEDLEAQRKKALAEGGKPRYDGRCRELGLGPAPGSVVRFKGPQSGQAAWQDQIKGPISFDCQELDDLVLLRGDGQPTYNLAVVVDDLTMGVTHIIRGDDHVNNTPRQILLYRALGAEPPLFGHVPMILGKDKTRLSKRHGATSVLAYRDLGYLPQALVNYLVRLGWAHGDQEVFRLQELIEKFSLKHVGKSAAVFNDDKLNWLNAHYLKQTPPQELAALMWPLLAARGHAKPSDAFLAQAAAAVRERGKTLTELADKAEFFFEDLPALDPQGAARLLTDDGRELLDDFGRRLLAAWPAERGDFDELLKALAQDRGVKIGQAAQPLRLALTGQTASPGLFEIVETLGPEKVQRRLAAALAWRPA
ncbi:MAG: glutamate--tRNA ligase [Deltaproteobacteria bacterium]|jgi:glutamyl-tRNA synthetase|nr:glutamate--tRNA ligase [Deltaproteobacteria bacterium]